MADGSDGLHIVNAICERLTGEWDAGEGEVDAGILVNAPCETPDGMLQRVAVLIVEVARSSYTWGLWRCRRCETMYSIAPKLPPVWVGGVARLCIDLYLDYQRAPAEASGSSGTG